MESLSEHCWALADGMDQDMEHVVAPETFRCTECKRLIPVEYMAKGRPYGLDDPVCEMCVSYYDYLNGFEQGRYEDDYED